VDETYAALTAEDFPVGFASQNISPKQRSKFAELIDEIITKAAGAEVSSVMGTA
jgi:hypothetical protein